ncbi:MAG: acyltransferase family protein [Armatimonadota bacterium]
MNLIGNFDTTKILMVVWSLVVEMRISLVFPFLYLAVNKLSPRIVVLLSFFILTLAWLLTKVDHSGNISNTLLYLPMFCIGILLANHQEYVTVWWTNLTTPCRVLFLTIAVFMYTWSYWAASLPHFLHLTPFVFSMITAACVIFIICAVAGQRTASVLRHRYLQIPGVSSYSLYLIHPLVLMAVLSIGNGFPKPLVLAFVVAVSIGFAYTTYLIIEKPSMRLGSILAKRMALAEGK